MMRAVIQREFGSPDVLTVEAVERPTPAPDEVLVRVHASPVTQGDRRLRSADFPGFTALAGRLMFGLRTPRFPVPGSGFAGRIEAVGDRVTRFRVGEDVFGSLLHGAHADYLTVSQDEGLALMPENLSYAEAASLPYGSVTALAFLADLGRLRPNERVLILGASGGVGRMAVQVAAHLGAEVTAVCRRDQALVSELGAARVLDYTDPGFRDALGRYDVVLDTVANRFGWARGMLSESGRYLSLYMTLRGLVQMATTTIGRGPRAICGVALPDREKLEAVRELAEAGALRCPISKRFQLEDIASAHAYLEQRPEGGDVVLMIGAAGACDTRSDSAGVATGPDARWRVA